MNFLPLLLQTPVPMARPARLFLLLFLLPVSMAAAAEWSVEATFAARLSGVPADAERISVWVPLPRDSSGQTIRELKIDSPYRWTRYTEPEFGNAYLYAVIENPKEEMELLRLRFQATRREVVFDTIEPTRLTERELQRSLGADRLVTLSPRIRQIADQVTRGKSEPLAQAKAIYDYVLATMTYDKTIPGWGNGDTERACDIRRGNCTDFHSLFISLVRAKGIPARFIMGVPMSGAEGETSGYHCWAEFYVEGKGWIPADPSEASKSEDPVRRAYLFGNVDSERLEFTMGRDLRLEPPTSEPLNLFIYPYAELKGKTIGRPSISFSFHDVVAAHAVATGGEDAITAAPGRANEVLLPGSHEP